MRLTEKDIIAGLGHPSVHVREPLFDYFEHHPEPTLELTHAVMAVVDKHGWSDAFYWPHKIQYCRHDEQSLFWCLDQLDKLLASSPLPNIQATLPFHLARWVIAAPVELLSRHHDRMAANAMFQQRLFRDTETPLQQIDRRIEIAALDAEEAWERLNDYCDSIANVQRFGDARIDRARELLQPIIAAGGDFRDRVLEILGDPRVNHEGADGWIVGLMIELAGKLGIEEALPHLLRKFDVDWDWYNDSIGSAITSIGTPEAFRQVIESYPDRAWYVRNYLTLPLESIHFDGVAERILPLIDREPDDGLKVQLAIAMSAQFDDFAIESARKIYREYPEDPERHAIIEKLYALVCVADIDLPEKEVWGRAIENDWKRFRESDGLPSRPLATIAKSSARSNNQNTKKRTRSAPFSQPNLIDSSIKKPQRKAERVGRNDACPCGSGLKYKKCCMRAANQPG